jgi:hypothetical protein
LSGGGRWRGLYRVGGIAAPVAVAVLICEAAAAGIWPQPTSVAGCFKVFESNWLTGLVSMDLLGMVCYIVMIPVIMAMYFALRRASEGLVAVGLALFLIGVAVYFSTNTAFSQLSLSHQYSVAATEVQRTALLSAGQVMLTTFNVGAVRFSYAIVCAGWVVIGTAMLRSAVFGKVTAWAGILAGVSSIAAIAIEHLPIIGAMSWLLFLAYASGIVFFAVWVILAGRTLRSLAARDGVQE